jgi:hypothetical protein
MRWASAPAAKKQSQLQQHDECFCGVVWGAEFGAHGGRAYRASAVAWIALTYASWLCCPDSLAVRVALFRVRGANVGRLWGELRSSRRPGLTRLCCSVASTDPCLTVVQLRSPMTRRGVTGTIRELLMQRKQTSRDEFP